MARIQQRIYVQHDGQKREAAIAQLVCPQDVPRSAIPELDKEIAALRGARPYMTGEYLAELDEKIAKLEARLARAKSGPRLGGTDELIDASLLIAVVPEDNGDPNYDRTKAARTEWRIERGLSNVRRARTPAQRTDGTWWEVEEDATPKGGN